MADLARVGVVVVTYASALTVGATLDALPVDELGGLVVVDNASPDDTVAVLREREVQVVGQANLGFSAGNNRGVHELSTELVLFLNPDAVLARDDLARLVDHLDRNPRCAVVGPRMTSGGRPTYSAGRLATLGTEVRPLLPDPLSRVGPRRRQRPGSEVTGPVGYVEGACFLVRRSALGQVGGFDEGYFLYFEELDLAQRLRLAGLEVHLCAEATAEHVMGASTSATAWGGSPHLVRSCVRYLQTWHGHRTARTWAAAARASWVLRARTGRLPADERAALGRALEEALSHPAPPRASTTAG